jgi:hypothetical protein
VPRSAPLFLIWLLACRPSPPPVLTTREVAEISASSGAVSATLISDPNAPSVNLGPGEEFVPAQLAHWNRPPWYPSELVSLNLKPHKVVLRITFDEKGRICDMAESPLERSTATEHRARFEEAARFAVAEWECHPPQIRKFRPGPDSDGDGKADYRIMTDRRLFKTFFDVAFTFEVVNGQPVVRPSHAGASQ